MCLLFFFFFFFIYRISYSDVSRVTINSSIAILGYAPTKTRFFVRHTHAPTRYDRAEPNRAAKTEMTYKQQADVVQTGIIAVYRMQLSIIQKATHPTRKKEKKEKKKEEGGRGRILAVTSTRHAIRRSRSGECHTAVSRIIEHE
jgi:hypothetical protein